MQTSPRLGLAYIQPSQAQKHVTANESFRRLDALVQLSVKSATTAAEPAAPAEGDAYILPAAPAGASWSLFAAGAIAAFQDGAWTEIAPGKGWRAYAHDAGQFSVFDGAAWKNEAALGAEAKFSRLEINLDQASPTLNHGTALNPNAAAGAQVRVSLQRGGDAGSGLSRGSVWFVTSSSLGFADYEARPIKLLTGTTPGAAASRLDVTPAGDVGIGTTAPVCKLDVDGPVRVKSFAKTSLPSAAGAGQVIYVSNEAGGAVLAFSDGTSWRRVTDRAVVS